MNLPKPQPLQDWLSQAWNILFGRKIGPTDNLWLLGPISETTEIGEALIRQIAKRENLSIDDTSRQCGLVHSFNSFTHLNYPVRQEIQDFYLQASEFEFDVWTQWSRGFSFLGVLVKLLFAKRIAQLNLPHNPLDTAYGITSDIIRLRDPEKKIYHTIWLRRLKKTGHIMYLGFYCIVKLPKGENCFRVVFPLPQGSATVILGLQTDPHGNLELVSKGNDYDDAGFYFIVRDAQGQYWKHFLKHFSEKIRVYVDNEGVLRTDHSMSVYGLTAFRLHYRMQRKKQ